jgi:hypothetical protein
VLRVQEREREGEADALSERRTDRQAEIEIGKYNA